MFTCCGPPGPDAEAQDLTRDEVKELYKRCLSLNDGRLIVHGLFARADAVTVNRRSYPKRLLAREVARYQKERIARGTALGELDHPSYASGFFRSLNLPNVTHQVLYTKWHGRELWGAAEILPTPSGLLAWELYSRGATLGISSRSWASLLPGTGTASRVADDLELITFDLVVDPSNSGALLVPLRTRYRQHIPDQTKIVQLAHLRVGSCAMASIGQLPAPATVQRVLQQMRRQQEATQQAAAAAAAAAAAQQAEKDRVQQGRACDEHGQQQQQRAGLAQGHPLGCPTSVLPPPPSAVQDPNSHSFLSCSAVGTTVPALAAAAVPATAAVIVVPFDACMPGGIMRVANHYLATDGDKWLPPDPAGRCLRKHHSGVASGAFAMAAAAAVASPQQQQQQQQRLDSFGAIKASEALLAAGLDAPTKLGAPPSVGNGEEAAATLAGCSALSQQWHDTVLRSLMV